MKITTTKTTTTNTTVKMQTTLTDDSGKVFATITGTVDRFHPLGTATLAVANSALYNANKDAAAEAYAAFQSAIAGIDATTESTTEDVELGVTEDVEPKANASTANYATVG